MPRHFLSAIACPLALAAAATAHAQTRAPASRDTTVHRLRGVTAQASRPIARSGGASAIAVALDSLPLPPAPTAATVLRELPFVQVRTNPRGEAYFANRGSGFDAREVAVLVDGVPASLNFDDRADLGALPIAGARTLTLVRGLPSLLFGPNVLGGLVELDVAGGDGAAPAEPALSLTTAMEHPGGRALSGDGRVPLRVGGASGWLRAGGGYRRSAGFPLPRGVREPAPFDTAARRLNSDREQHDAFLASRLEGGGGAWLSLSSFAYSGLRGTPAELGASAPQLLRFPLLQRSFTVAAAGTGDRASPLGGRAALRLGVGYDHGRTRLESYTTRAYTTQRSREEDVDRNVDARLLGTQSLPRGAELSGALTVADVRRHEALEPGATNAYRQRLWSAATELGVGLPGMGALTAVRATAGLARDGAGTPETGDKPPVASRATWGGRVGVTAASAGGTLLLHAGISRRVRFPALREMYSGAAASVEPNPDLRPEALVATEAGATMQAGDARLQAVAFHNVISDAIVRTTVNKKVKRVNRDETRATGLELLASAPVWRASLAADLTAQAVTSRDASAGVAFQAEYQPKFAGGVRLAAPLPLAATLDAGARIVGSQYCVSAANGYDRLAPATRVSAHVSRWWRWGSDVETTLGVDNLADAAVYDQCGLPQPGRVLTLQLRLR